MMKKILNLFKTRSSTGTVRIEHRKPPILYKPTGIPMRIPKTSRLPKDPPISFPVKDTNIRY